MTRYLVGLFSLVILIVVIFILILRGPSSSPVQQLNLFNDSNADIAVQLTIDSPVSASSTHHDIIVNVDSNQATLTITNGYQGKVDFSQSYPMSGKAFAAFLDSLQLNGFTVGNHASSLSNDQGHCALGDRYIYEVINGGGQKLQRYWYTSCDTGTFGGNASVIQQLFDAQIPDYANQTSDINL